VLNAELDGGRDNAPVSKDDNIFETQRSYAYVCNVVNNQMVRREVIGGEKQFRSRGRYWALE
jgi:hypothetical protein